MASLQPHLVCSLFSPTSRSTKLLLPTSTLAFTSTSTSTSTHPALYLFPAKKLKLPTSRYGTRSVFCFFSKSHDAASQISNSSDSQRPPFDINLAVILAGFAFEAYTTPPDNIGVKELDAAGCQTVYLSESFLREIYDGQLLVKLKKGTSFPAMDPWGTSDPYVVLQLDAQVVKSKVKWGTKDPTWNEEFTINIKQDPTKSLQVAAWDANLVTPHKRMGNGRINLEGIFDGNPHEVLVELEGIGGGGRIQLEIKYRSFHDIDEGKKWWDVPFLSEFLRKNGLASALASVIGPGSMPAGQFGQYAFGKLKSFNDERLSKYQKCLRENNEDMDIKSNKQLTLQSMPSETDSNAFSANANSMGTQDSHQLHALEQSNVQLSKLATQFDAAMHSDFWKNFSDAINQNVVQKLGLPAPENLKWDGFELLNQIGLQSKNIAEAGYVESGLATPDNPDMKNGDESGGAIKFGNIQASLPDIKKTVQEVLRQTDSVFGALIVLSAEKPQSNEKWVGNEIRNVSVEKAADVPEYLKERLLTEVTEGVELDEKKAEEMKALFTTAETAMEAWAMLASAVGHPSFVKSEFEKLCFLDNASTDTQVALWRDSARRRLVVAFRGTEQARWKDLMTDLMLVPAGLNPERIGGDFKQEVQVHSGFLGAYDSVRTRLISLVKLSIGFARWLFAPGGGGADGLLRCPLMGRIGGSRRRSAETSHFWVVRDDASGHEWWMAVGWRGFRVGCVSTGARCFGVHFNFDRFFGRFGSDVFPLLLVVFSRLLGGVLPPVWWCFRAALATVTLNVRDALQFSVVLQFGPKYGIESVFTHCPTLVLFVIPQQKKYQSLISVSLPL
ncbi:unnamed protein product [Rhodiola kirilowii]